MNIFRLAKPCQMPPSSNGAVVSKHYNKYYASCPNGTSSFCSAIFFWPGLDYSRCFPFSVSFGGMTCDKMILEPFPTCVNDCKFKFFILFYQDLIWFQTETMASLELTEIVAQQILKWISLQPSNCTSSKNGKHYSTGPKSGTFAV